MAVENRLLVEENSLPFGAMPSTSMLVEGSVTPLSISKCSNDLQDFFPSLSHARVGPRRPLAFTESATEKVMALDGKVINVTGRLGEKQLQERIRPFLW